MNKTKSLHLHSGQTPIPFTLAQLQSRADEKSHISYGWN